jgi:hypothetical protein
MATERILSRSLVAFLCLVAGSLLAGAYQGLRRPGLAEAVQRLRDGDLERAERLLLWREVREQARGSGARDDWLAGAMASVCLGDREAYAAFAARLGRSEPPVTASDAAAAALASLGESCLSRLLAGWNAERAGQREAAGLAYRQAAASAPLWGLPLAGDLAREGIARLR